MKRGKIVSVLLLSVLVSVLFLSSVFAIVSQTPHGIKGYVLFGDGTQVPSGTDFSINDTTSDFFIAGTTSGPGGITAWYSVSMNGTDGDLVVIKAWNATHYGLRLVELDGDMLENITLNVNNNAPRVQPVKGEGHERGVWLTPELPANNTDIVCNYESITDPNGDPFTVNYTWVKDGVEQNNSIFELTIDKHTTLLSRFDNTLNATYAKGDGNVSIAGTISLSSARVNGGADVTVASSYFNYSTLDNLNSTEGTIEFWFQPAWNASTTATSHLFLDSFFGASDRFWLLFSSVSDELFFYFGSASDSIKTSISDWNEGEWHHVAITWAVKNEEAGTKTHISLFVDGELKAFDIRSSTMTFKDQLTIGAMSSGAFSSDGIFDELRFSNKERSLSEIWASYSDSVLYAKNTQIGQDWSCRVIPKDSTGLEGYFINSDSYEINNYEVDFFIYDQTSNYLNETLKAGKPIGFEVSVTKAGSAIEGARVEAFENNGLGIFSFFQDSQTNVTTKSLLTTYTDSAGVANFTVIPSGAKLSNLVKTDFELAYGWNYEVGYDVFIGDEHIYREIVPISRGDRYPESTMYKAPYVASGFPNSQTLTDYYDLLFSVYMKVRYSITGGGTR